MKIKDRPLTRIELHAIGQLPLPVSKLDPSVGIMLNEEVKKREESTMKKRWVKVHANRWAIVESEDVGEVTPLDAFVARAGMKDFRWFVGSEKTGPYASGAEKTLRLAKEMAMNALNAHLKNLPE
jgi:hypothetical protein